jgi:TolB-like protein/DNA-binding SARP family transcriptional activator
MSIRIKLLGGAVIETAEGLVAGRATQRHRIALLALLATTRRPGRSRDQLIGLLWPDADTARARHLLSDAVYRINQGLGVEGIVASGDDLRLNGQLVSSDVADFERASLVSDHLRVVELYGGPFLDGFFLSGAEAFERWVEDERASYAREFARSLEALADAAELQGDTTAAVDWWKRLAVLQPESSRVAQRLVRAYEASGDRAAALRHGQLHLTLLKEALDLEPDAALVEYLRELKERPAPGARTEPAVAREAMLVPPEAVPDPAPAVRAPGVPDESARGRPRRWPWMVAVAAFALAATWLSMRRPGERAPPVNASPSVAVLPFRNLSPSDTTAYFADGMTEELIYMLARVPGLRVSSRTSVYAYRDSSLTVRDLARRLNVTWVVEGAVRREGDQLRITAQLTKAEDGYQQWSESFDREQKEVFSIQEGIAAAIAERVAQRTVDSTGTQAARRMRGADDPVAYDLFLQGRYHWHRRSERDLRLAVSLFRQAVERAPRYSRGWMGLGDAQAVLGFYDYLPPKEAFVPAAAAARRALEIDPLLAAPHATLGYVHLYYDWDLVAAEREFRQAISMDPTYSTAHQWLANLLTARGRFDEAEREMQAARQLDPLSLIANTALGWVWIIAGQPERAITQLRAARELDPGFQLAWLWLGTAQGATRSPEALTSLREAVRLSDSSAISMAALAQVLAQDGRADSARAILASLLAREERGAWIPSWELARIYVALGDTSSALARLGRAVEAREHSVVFIEVDHHFDPLRASPRFASLVRQVRTGGSRGD